VKNFDLVFGEVDGFPPGTTFPDRKSAHYANIHRGFIAGIASGGTCICLNEGYADDVDNGDEIIYTGQGGQDDKKNQVCDQELVSGNKALVENLKAGRPIRVLRGHKLKSSFAPASGYRYDGLYYIERYWLETGKHGFKVYRFRLKSKNIFKPKKAVNNSKLKTGDLKTQILNVLSSGEAVTAMDIANRLGVRTTMKVNSILYKLLYKKVKKDSSHQWSLIQQNYSAEGINKKNSEEHATNLSDLDRDNQKPKKKILLTELGSIESTVNDLLSGSVVYEASKSLSIHHITHDARLINCYEHCNYSDLYSFLKLGEKRFKIRNYGKGSEEKLRQAITKRLESHGLEGSSVTAVNREKNYLTILEQLQKGKSAKKLISERDWDFIRKAIKDNFKESLSYPISKIALQIGMYWPLEGGPYANNSIHDLIDYSIPELFKIRSLGIKKVNTFVACVINVYTKGGIVTCDNIEGAIQSLWESSNLSKKEQRMITLRYGIQEERKHTLEELAHLFEVTRERTRQIIKKAFKKIHYNPNFERLAPFILAQKNGIWNLLTSEDKLEKKVWMEPLEDSLGFNFQLAIELTNQKRNKNINTSALNLWLDEVFPHDESFWYRDHSVMSRDSVHKLHVNSDLDAFLSEI
jgi:hypothetical protein